jgi:NTP pyrophosphatase (non-canonical NTP hydrolase)
MVDLKQLQEEVYQNKVRHGFNTTNIDMEFCLAYGELGEAYIAYLKKKEDLGEELADVVIYLLGVSRMLNIDLEKEVVNKIEKNSKRVYKENSKGVLVKEEELNGEV